MENTMLFISPAEKFEEALPVGNGSTGAMFYGRTDKEKISFNHESLWSGTGEKTLYPKMLRKYTKKFKSILWKINFSKQENL